MTYLALTYWILILSILSCNEIDKKNTSKQNNKQHKTCIHKNGSTVSERFIPKNGFTRVNTDVNSFAHYLQNLTLKPDGSIVKYFNGNSKYNHNVYNAVINMDIGSKDLQQCADAIMRLKGEYHYKMKEYNKIHFNLTNGFNVPFEKWVQGYRVIVNGNKTSWKKNASKKEDYPTFRKYMDFIFMYAGTLSLSKELKPVNIQDMKIGDVFIQGGSPGHAVIVIDMAINNQTGEKVFMLAQSYMPAQEIQILQNPNSQDSCSWYNLEFGKTLTTPEWTFRASDLKRFQSN